MEQLADTIVQDIVTAEQKEGEQTVDQFTQHVEDKASAVADELQVTYGDAVKNIAGQVMDSAKSYATSRQEILDPNAAVGDAHAIGAAAYTDMSNRLVTYDTSAMDFTLPDPEYWQRVKEHEKIHQTKQAGAYNAQEITFMTETGETETVKTEAIVEWQASQANETSDLTSDYRQHLKDGESLVAIIGKDRVEQALVDGNMQKMQHDIFEEQLPEIIDHEIDVPVGAEVSS